jgi:transcriptional regulator with XRE-family HTH domain
VRVSNVGEPKKLSLVRTPARAANPEVGARVRACRLQRHFSQAGLAQTAGIGQGSLSNYELGKRGLTLEAASRIATALGTTLADLVGSEEQPHFVEDGADARLEGDSAAVVTPAMDVDEPGESSAAEPASASTVLRFQVSERQVEIAVSGGPLTRSEIGVIRDYLAVQEKIGVADSAPTLSLPVVFERRAQTEPGP